MRLHTDKLTTLDLNNIREAVVNAGLMDGAVHFDKLEPRGSRTRRAAFEVHLATEAKRTGDGRRRQNSGTSGGGPAYAATYDEWGWLISEIFERDPEAVFGNYKSRDDFHNQTHGAYQF